MNLNISELIQSFETNAKIPKKKYNDFVRYVYYTFDTQISACKVNKTINKYKKMRASILQYIVTNERIITAEICKNK